MSRAGKLLRGEKWKRSRAHHKAMGTPNHLKAVKWIDSQRNILADIKFYEDSLKPAPTPEEEPKKKGKRGR